MSNDKPSVEDSFREALEDVVDIAKGLLVHCHSIEDLIGVVELGLAHDCQLKFLMSLVKQKKK